MQGRRLAGWAGAEERAPALGSRSIREKERKGRGWPGRGLPTRIRLEPTRTPERAPSGEAPAERCFEVAGGLVPRFKRAGISLVRAVPEPQREPGRGASANPASERAGPGERTNL